MRFHLIKDMHTTFFEDKAPTPESNILYTPKTAILKNSISLFTPILSRKGPNSNEFWSTEVMEKCRAVLIEELYQKIKSLDPTIMIKLTSPAANGKFTVQIRDSAMLVNIYKVCKGTAKLLVEISFLDVHGAKTKAELITREIGMCQDSPDPNRVSSFDSGILGTEAMRQFWEYHNCSYKYNVERFNTKTIMKTTPMNAICNVLLVVADKWDLFKPVFDLEASGKLLNNGLQSDVAIVTDDGSFKCQGLSSQRNREMFQHFLEKVGAVQCCHRFIITGIRKATLMALLRFMFCEQLPTDDLEMTFELLKMSQKFKIPSLECAAIEALFQKPDTDFGKEFAEKVFMYVANLPSAEKLMNKTFQIITS